MQNSANAPPSERHARKFCNKFGKFAGLKLFQQAGAVNLDRAIGQAKLKPDFLGGEPATGQDRHLALALREGHKRTFFREIRKRPDAALKRGIMGHRLTAHPAPEQRAIGAFHDPFIGITPGFSHDRKAALANPAIILDRGVKPRQRNAGIGLGGVAKDRGKLLIALPDDAMFKHRKPHGGMIEGKLFDLHAPFMPVARGRSKGIA